MSKICKSIARTKKEAFSALRANINAQKFMHGGGKISAVIFRSGSALCGCGETVAYTADAWHKNAFLTTGFIAVCKHCG